MGIVTPKTQRPSLLGWLFGNKAKPKAAASKQVLIPSAKGGVIPVLGSLASLLAAPGAYNAAFRDIFNKPDPSVKHKAIDYEFGINEPQADEETGVIAKTKKFTDPRIGRSLSEFVFGMANIFGGPRDSDATFTSSFFSFFKTATSLGAGISTPIASLSKAFGAYFNKPEVMQAASYWGIPGMVLMPAVSNLRSLLHVFSSIRESIVDRTKSFKDAMYDRGLNFAHVLQGVIGGSTSILALPGMLAHTAKKLVAERAKLTSLVRIFGEYTYKFYKFTDKHLGTDYLSKHSHNSEFENERRFGDYAVNFMKNVVANSLNNNVIPALEDFMNAPIFASILKRIMPVRKDANGEDRITLASLRTIASNMARVNEDYALETEGATHQGAELSEFYGWTTPDEKASKHELEHSKQNKLFGGLVAKSKLPWELFKLLNPLQTSLMLLPMAFTKLADKDIQTHGILPMRVFDRLLGVGSSILMIPNYLGFIATKKLPQMVAYALDLKERYENNKASEHGFVSSYNVVANLENILEKFNDPSSILAAIPFKAQLAKILELEVLKRAKSMNGSKSKMDKIIAELEEESARRQQSLQAPQTISSIRNLMKLAIGRVKFFRASVDEYNLGPAEHGKMMIKKFLDKAHQLVMAVPGGGLLSPIFNVIKKPFNVNLVGGKKKKAAAGAKAQANKTEQNPQNTKPLAQKDLNQGQDLTAKAA